MTHRGPASGEPVDTTRLPHIDEHTVTIDGSPDAVWPFLVDAVERAFTAAPAQVAARLLGCADTTATGPRPLADGSTVPGFHVAAAVPPTSLVLAGGHRFSRYTLRFRLEPLGPGRARLRAASDAEFPGAAGRLYRLAVVGSGGHRVAVRRLLSAVGRRARTAAVAPH